MFLDEVNNLADLPKILTYDEISHKLGTWSCWIELIWGEMVSAGHAYYINDFELNSVYLRYNVLANFYYAFLNDFRRDAFMDPPQDVVVNFELPQEFLDGLLKDFIARQHSEFKEEPDIHFVMDKIARNYIYPLILAYSCADIKRVATLLCQHSEPLDVNGDAYGFITGPEDTDESVISEDAVLGAIKKWLEYKFKPSY